MAKNLVIVESPAKAKTIEKFLGKDYKVLSSYGHIRDLHKKDFSIDIEKDFAPIYEIPAEKKDVVNTLKKNVKEAETVWLASDEDREGEAIAWHLYETLKLTPEHTRRIVFHEITKPAILNAIENPRDIDINLVDAQQARRVLDRIVGFELSPVLWRKIKPELSAGRVQSVAVRLIVDREKEIEGFKSETYFRVTAEFHVEGSTIPIRAELSHRLKSKEEAMAFLEECKNAEFSISDITVKEVKKSPAPPFTTSTLQQDANRKLGFSVSQTMMVAQKLYESGYITYMRTDSLNLSSLAIGTISGAIKEEMGEKYLRVRSYHTKSKGAQEAHEAIRPTYITEKQAGTTAQEKKLYELIWKRAIASQMSDAILEKTNITISINGRQEKFVAQGEVVKFDGFLKVYNVSSLDDDDQADGEHTLPAVSEGDVLTAETIDASMRYTQQPPRYNEASLVKKMEELGIGRPSTYAPTIGTILTRKYIVKSNKEGEKRKCEILSLKGGKIKESSRNETVGSEKGKLIPTDIGRVVNDFLEKFFPDIMDYNFTAKVEEEFDNIAEGGCRWNDQIGKFYKIFHPSVEAATNIRLEHKVGERVLGKDSKTGYTLSVKIGKYGPIAQLGSVEEVAKPQFANIPDNMSINTITLEEALELFKLPRVVGEFEGAEITVAVGRFGPYIRHDGKFVSIPKEYAPETITLEETIALIVEKRENEKGRVINVFGDIQVLNGRFGPYIAYNKKNYKIPKTTDAATLDEEACRAIIKQQDEAPAAPRRARRVAKSK